MERCGRLLCARSPGSSWSIPAGSPAAPELASAAGPAGGLLGRAPWGPWGPFVREGGLPAPGPPAHSCPDGNCHRCTNASSLKRCRPSWLWTCGLRCLLTTVNRQFSEVQLSDSKRMRLEWSGDTRLLCPGMTRGWWAGRQRLAGLLKGPESVQRCCCGPGGRGCVFAACVFKTTGFLLPGQPCWTQACRPLAMAPLPFSS